jgi:hypothetical protein
LRVAKPSPHFFRHYYFCTSFINHARVPFFISRSELRARFIALEDAKRKSPTPWMLEKRAKGERETLFKFFPLVRSVCIIYVEELKAPAGEIALSPRCRLQYGTLKARAV